MKIYQAHSSDYYIPKNVYMIAYYSIKDYERMKNVIENNPNSVLRYEVEAIERAFRETPKEYREAVWNNLANDEKMPGRAKAYTIAKSRFVYLVARYAKFL